jgi:hypothetical protein
MFYEGRVLVKRVLHLYMIFYVCLYFCAFYAQNTCMYTLGHVNPFTCLSSKSMKLIVMEFVIWGQHLKFSGARVVGITTLATSWTVWGSNSGRVKRFFLFQNVQTGSGANPASYPMDTGALS